jgi:hypothetical protein
MPGLERLLDRFDIDGYPTLTQSQARELRRRAAKALNRDGATLNAKTFTEIADTLDGAERKTESLDTCAIVTFGDFLANVHAVEQAAGNLRATADSMNDEPGTGYWRIQAGIYEADAEYRKHPSFSLLEAQVNRRYGPFTYANLLRIRGEVCEVRDCRTEQVNQLCVEDIVTALRSTNLPSGKSPSATTTPRQVNTRPASVVPPGPSVDAAMLALPSVLNNAPQPQGVVDPAGRRGADYAILRQRLEAVAFNRDAVEWAIHRHVEAGRLEATPGLIFVPYVIGRDVPEPPSGTVPTREREQCVLWAQPAMWEWWNAIESGQPVNGVSMNTNPTTPPAANPAGQQQSCYTMSDIRDLLRYRREWAAYEQWCNTTSRTSYSVSELHTRACAMAFNAPNPARLNEDQAVGLAVYRCLVRAALEQFGRELDEQLLLLFVGEVAGRHRRPVAEMWSLAHEEFGRLMAESQEDEEEDSTGHETSAEDKKKPKRRGPRGRSRQQIEADIKLYGDYQVSGLTKEELVKKRFRADEFDEMMTRLETGRKDHADREKAAKSDGD